MLEKFLLLFIILRPTLDYFRETVIFSTERLTLNLNAVFALLLFFWSLAMLAKYWREIKPAPLRLALPALSVLMLASAFWSVSPFTSLIESVKFLDITALFLFSYVLVKEKKVSLREIIISIIVSAIIPILAGLIQLFTGQGMSTFGLHGRIYGTFGHPNVFAFFLLFLLFLLIQYRKSIFWQKHKSLLCTFYFLLFTLLLMTYTRAAWVGLLVFLMAIGILKYRKMLAWLISGLVLFYLVFYPLNNFLIQHYNFSLQKELPLLSRTTERSEEADSFEWRKSLVRENIPLIRAKPLLGYGYGTFPLVWEANRSMEHFWDDSAEAHNDYLRLTVEIGILGLLVYLIILGRLLQANIAASNLYLTAWIVTFIVVSVSDNMLHHTPVMWLMWSWWGAMLAAHTQT